MPDPNCGNCRGVGHVKTRYKDYDVIEYCRVCIGDLKQCLNHAGAYVTFRTNNCPVCKSIDKLTTQSSSYQDELKN